MTMFRRLFPLALLLAGTPLAAQDAYVQGGYGYAQSGYDADGQSVDSVDVFIAPLSRYGRWLDSRYGRVWAPNVPRDWRPYTVGHWEEGRFGQTWRSDEPFGWAVFHFGRWAFDPAIGWVWSPDTVWGPGWVAWRDGDDVTGWAPLPPQVSVGFAFGSGYGFNDWGYDQWYQPGWSYVPRGYLYSRSLRGVYLPFARNREIWERTRGVTRYDRVDGQVVNRSFGFRGQGYGRDGRDVGRDGGRDFRRDDRDGHRDAGTNSQDPRRTDFNGRDPRRADNGRDGRRDYGRADPRTLPLYGSAPRQAPPAADSGVPRTDARPGGFGGRGGFERRDGFVPGTAPAQFDRRTARPPVMMAPQAAGQGRPSQPMPAPMMTPATPLTRPQMPAPQPPAIREAPAPRPAQPRERNPNERPQ